jgi:hypothetical protein
MTRKLLVQEFPYSDSETCDAGLNGTPVVQLPNARFYENPFSGFRIVTCWHMGSCRRMVKKLKMFLQHIWIRIYMCLHLDMYSIRVHRWIVDCREKLSNRIDSNRPITCTLLQNSIKRLFSWFFFRKMLGVIISLPLSEFSFGIILPYFSWSYIDSVVSWELRDCGWFCLKLSTEVSILTCTTVLEHARIFQRFLS